MAVKEALEASVFGASFIGEINADSSNTKGTAPFRKKAQD
jgi:hypothetical protein